MAGIRVEGNVSGNVAEVDVDNNLHVNLPISADLAGYALLAGCSDEGTVTGAREIKSVSVSEEHRLLVGVDSLIFNDTFNYAAQNSGNYRYPATTQTIAHSAGYLILNSGNITSINTNCAVQTYRNFPIFGGFLLKWRVTALHTAAPQVNAVTEFGLFMATLPGAAIPTDGAYFRFTSAGTFVAVINYNGSETVSANLPIPAANVNHVYEISLLEEVAEFFVDGILQADLDTPVGTGQPFISGSLPWTSRHYIGGSAPASAMQFKVSDIDVNLGDMNTTKPWAHVMSSSGLCGYQGQNGGTMGSTALYTNSLAPGAGAAMTNTTAALGSGLGGQFTTQPTLAANTDGIVCSYQNPAGTPTQSGRTLMIAGIKIDSFCSAAITGGPLFFLFSLAFGHTAVSLATAEAATAKAPRRIPLGIQTFVITTPIGALGQTIAVHFDSPVPVNPGEFVAVVAKNSGTVSSAGTITFLVSLDSYNE